MRETTQEPLDGFRSITRDEEKARRILNLFFVLNATRRPIPTSQIVEDPDIGYGGGNLESEKRKFKRDRLELESLGIHIVESKEIGSRETEESSWIVDRERTHVGSGILSIDDAEELQAAIDRLLERDGLPYRMVLEKIRRKLLPGSSVHDADGGLRANPIEEAVWAAFSLHKILPFSYIDAQGELSQKRRVAIYGIFSQEGIDYLVGWDQDRGALRTFRIDRIERVFKPSGSYQIPEDFSVLDHLFLSFDFGGGEPMRALFSFREGIPRAEVERITHRRGAIKRADDRSWLWSIEIRDPMAAARFALSHSSLGMKPLEPTVVVDMWRDSIERTVDSLGA